MIQLRPVREKDSLFIESVFRSTREDELALTNWPEQQKNAFIIMQSMAQLADYKKNYPDAEWQIIVFNNKDAGRLYTWEGADKIHVLDISLLPLFRGKGIGTHLLKDLMKKSNAANKKIALHVESGNHGALRLYQSLGFIHLNTNGRHYYMERPADVLK